MASTNAFKAGEQPWMSPMAMVRPGTAVLPPQGQQHSRDGWQQVQTPAAAEGLFQELRERPGDDGADLGGSRPDADHLPALLVGVPQLDGDEAAVRQVA